MLLSRGLNNDDRAKEGKREGERVRVRVCDGSEWKEEVRNSKRKRWTEYKTKFKNRAYWRTAVRRDQCRKTVVITYFARIL